MRVLLAHKFFRLVGGAEVFFLETGKALERQGHEVAYFSTVDDENLPSDYSDYFVQAPEYRSGSIARRILNLPKMIYSRDAKRQFARLLQDFKPDIVHFFAVYVHLSPSILDACREAGVPVVMSCNDYKLICTNYKLYHHGRICEECKGGRYHRAVVNHCCHDSRAFSVASFAEAFVHGTLDIYRKNVHTFLFASEFMAHKTEEFWGADTFQWELLRNPLDLSEYHYHEAHDDYILYFGRLIDEKGVDVLVKAMAMVSPDVKLVIVGEGPDEAALRAQAKTLDHIEFVGPKWGEELRTYLERCRFVVCPSIWHENFPYVILQAFATGKPVVGTDRGGIPELIQNGTHGLEYPAQDPEALATCIDTLWNDDAGCREMGRRARTYVEQEFNDDAFYASIMRVYEGVLTCQ